MGDSEKTGALVHIDLGNIGEAGVQLSSICNVDPVEGFWKYVRDKLISQGYELLN